MPGVYNFTIYIYIYIYIYICANICSNCFSSFLFLSVISLSSHSNRRLQSW